MNQAKEQFIFDLQLFNDGEPAPAAEPAPQETPAAEPPAAPQNTPPAATPADSPIDYSELSKSKPDDQLAFLKKNGFLGQQKQEPPTKPEEIPEPPANDNPVEQPPVVDPEFEIKVNGEVKKVKQSELVELAQKGADYTRKTQELADQRRQLDILLEQQRTGTAAQPPANQQVKPSQQAEQEYRAVVAQTEKNLGLDPGGFNQFDPVHQFELNKVTLEHNSQQLSRQQMGNRVETFVQQMKQDPLAQQVDKNYDSYLFKMGAEGTEGAVKANAIMASKQRFFAGNASTADLDILEAHWNYVKAALSASAAPPKPIPVPQTKPQVEPPRTETPGNGVAPTKEKINYKNLGHLKQSDQLAALRKAGFLKRG